MAEPWVAAIIIPIFFLIFLLIMCKSCYIVNQSEVVVIERFGRFNRILESGLSFVIPFVDSPRLFPWQHAVVRNNDIDDVSFSTYRIDLREAVFHFPDLDVYTRDTLLLTTNSIMYYRISDVRKAIYEVDDLQNALSAAAQTHLKEVFGLMTFHEALECQDFINEYLVAEFSNLFEKWGVEVTRMEMLGISPGKSEYQTINAMKLQMIAERKRRGEFIRSEGQKAASNIEAEGTKKVALTMGVAEQESMRKISEGRAQATVMLAQAEKASLDAISAVTQLEGTSLAQYFMTSQFMGLFRHLRLEKTDVMYLPYEPLAFSGIISNGITRAFGHKPDRSKVAKYTPKPAGSLITASASSSIAAIAAEGVSPAAFGASPSSSSSSSSSAKKGPADDRKEFAGLD